MGKDLDIYTAPVSKELEVAPEIIDAEIVAEVVEVLQPYIELSENNSGGHWWLSDEDWAGLEKAGWEVEWAEVLRERDHLFASSFELGEDGKWRYMGARARGAKRYGVSLRVAMAEFQDITGQDPNEEGCPCCGEPHYFSERDAQGNWI